MDSGEITPEMVDSKVSELQSEYTKKSGDTDNVLKLKSADDLAADGTDELEQAMASAIEGGDETASTDNVVSMNGAAVNEDNIIRIAIESPVKLSDDKISKGKTILSEIGMEKMFFFSSKAFTEGQSIVIQFCIPKTFIVNADVIYCRPFNIKSRIISQNNYTHRMLIKFNFLKDGERALLRQFIQSIEPDITKIVKKAPTEEADSDEGDFNELDDLGL